MQNFNFQFFEKNQFFKKKMASSVLIYYTASHLVKAELDYEFRIREVTPTVVESMRRQFNALLDEYPAQAITTTDLDPEQEYNECSIRLSCLQELVEDFLENRTRLLYKRVCTKTTHIFYRVSRIVPTQDDLLNQLEKLKTEVGEIVKILEESSDIARGPSPSLLKPTTEALNTLSVNPVRSSSDNLFVPVVDSLVLPVPTSSSSGVPRTRPEPLFFDAVPSNSLGVDLPTRQERFSAPTVPLKREFDNTYGQVLKPLSLGFAYDGKSCVIEFLERLEENRRARNISDARLLKSACELFCDNGLIWYRTRASQFENWPQLARELRATFGSATYDRDLLKLVRERIQRPEEKLHIFVTIVVSYFLKLSRPLAESEQLEIIMSNLRPYLQHQFALITINSIDELLRLGKQLETAQLSIDEYNINLQKLNKNSKSTSSKKIHAIAQASGNTSSEDCLLEQSFVNCQVSAVESGSRNNQSQGSNQQRGGSNREGFSRGNTTNVGGPRGGSRGSRGARGNSHHGYSKYCYRCGKFNFTVTTCPDCSKDRQSSQAQPENSKNLHNETE